MKSALILGISGQDGSYLAELLLRKNYTVYGGTRDVSNLNSYNLKSLNIADSVEIFSIDLKDFRSVYQLIKQLKPDEVYNLSGQTSVGLSFEQPLETFNSISISNLNLLEAMRMLDYPIKLYNAGSSECFGNTSSPANELSNLMPRSPYATAKASSIWQVSNYREAYKQKK
jgi:GDPmannose 4,6-dehydratase